MLLTIFSTIQACVYCTGNYGDIIGSRNICNYFGSCIRLYRSGMDLEKGVGVNHMQFWPCPLIKLCARALTCVQVSYMINYIMIMVTLTSRIVPADSKVVY